MPLRSDATHTCQIASAALAIMVSACAESPVKPSPVTLAGELVFASHRTGGWRLWAMLPDGSEQRVLAPSFRGFLNMPSVAPGGRRVAFESSGDILVMNADGSDVRHLTSGPDYDLRPIWSPDGSVIAFESYRTGTGDIYLMAPDGTGLRRLTDSPEPDIPWSWSADGSRILFSRLDPDRGFVARMVARNGTDLGIIPLPEGGFTPALSPDGRRVAYIANSSGGLHLADITGENDRLLVTASDNPRHPQWSPDGAWITFDALVMIDSAQGWRGRDVLMMRPDGTDLRRLTDDWETDIEATWARGK